MSTRRPSRHDDYDSVDDREQGEPFTPTLEASTVVDQHKTEETMDGGQELKIGVDESVDGGDRSTMLSYEGRADSRGVHCC